MEVEPVIPLLAQHYHVIAISTDGYDGTGKTIFTTAENAAEKLETDNFRFVTIWPKTQKHLAPCIL